MTTQQTNDTYNLQSLLQSLKEAGKNLLSADLKTRLGNFSWTERLDGLETENDRLIIKFFSDGLDLAAKSQVEEIVKSVLKTTQYTPTVYFVRKEKTATQSNPSTPGENPARTPSGKKPITGVKKIIAVASGKGGVGKSTVSVNLALALYNQGYKVGILDADIYGPSIPTMLDIHIDPAINENNKIIPPEAYGLKVMSFGFFAPEETAVIWRGPMIMKALQQFFWDVEWGDLDFLIIDLPPGTGDAQLTLVQSLPLSGSVIVTTPQNVALLDAVKGIAMFRKTEVPIIGVVENMSVFVCPSCGNQSHVFGAGGAERVSQKFDVPVLGHIPLVTELRAAGDLGEPLVTKPGHDMRQRFSEIADRVVKGVYELS